MVRISLGGRAYELAEGESVLDGMVRHGVEIPSACRSGACHACLLCALCGAPGRQAQRGLKDTWRSAGYFLACQARPAADLTIALAGDHFVVPGVLRSAAAIAPGVLRVRIRLDERLDFQAGQHVMLRRADGLARAFSVANLPAEAARDGVELHVRVRPQGAMSGWLTRARPGARLGVRGPAGECFYVRGEPGRALLFAGSDTGIAPLTAIARDALASGHAGPIVILHAAAQPSGLYLDRELRELAAAHPIVRYRRCVGSGGTNLAAAAAAELGRFTGPTATRAYLCGGRAAVLSARRALFLAGMSLRDIHSDVFLPAVAPVPDES
ncbi:MAG TPA: 2Fe-2S iron-sulfur cluster binding domain-containing protein [Streptosporangiaceae bacterium]|nr:2Fe-2S iron-sulfur cluster binding domain-containing protein [Streptosporangiaceae bacterium]